MSLPEGVEFFSGKKAVTNALNAQGFTTLPYDIVENKAMDINTPEGFA